MKTTMEKWKRFLTEVLDAEETAVTKPAGSADKPLFDPEAFSFEPGEQKMSAAQSHKATAPKATAPKEPSPYISHIGRKLGAEPGQQLDLSDLTKFPKDSEARSRAKRWNAAQAKAAAPAAKATPAAKEQPGSRQTSSPSRRTAPPATKTSDPFDEEQWWRSSGRGLEPAAITPAAKELFLFTSDVVPHAQRAGHLQRRANRAAGYSSSGHRTAKKGGKKLAPITADQAIDALEAAEFDEGLTISRSKLTELIKEELREIMDLPSDLSTPAGPEEERMDALSKGWEELITTRMLDGETGIWSNTDVVDPIDGERRLLDEFLAILGNYVVSDEVDEGTARDLVKSIADQISDNLIEPSPHEWGIPLPKWENMPGFEPQDELQEGGRAGHLEPEDAILKALQNVVSAWEPETPEGQKYEADILDLLGRFEEPLRLSAPTDRDVRRLRHGVKTGKWREKKPWEK